MPHVPLGPGSMNATSVTGEPVNFKDIFSLSLRIRSNVAFQDFYVASGFHHNWCAWDRFSNKGGPNP